MDSVFPSSLDVFKVAAPYIQQWFQFLYTRRLDAKGHKQELVRRLRSFLQELWRNRDIAQEYAEHPRSNDWYTWDDRFTNCALAWHSFRRFAEDLNIPPQLEYELNRVYASFKKANHTAEEWRGLAFEFHKFGCYFEKVYETVR